MDKNKEPEKKLTLEHQKKYIFEKISFTLLKSTLKKCETYGYVDAEEKAELFNLLVNANTFVHKKKVTDHNYNQEICCIENLLVKCNLHSPEFLSVLIQKHHFSNIYFF